jgi:hypothetical protein
MYGQLDLPGEWVLLLQLFAALNTGLDLLHFTTHLFLKSSAVVSF